MAFKHFPASSLSSVCKEVLETESKLFPLLERGGVGGGGGRGGEASAASFLYCPFLQASNAVVLRSLLV